MRNLGLIILLIIIIFYGWRMYSRPDKKVTDKNEVVMMTPKKSSSEKKDQKVVNHTSLFVPYWSLSEKEYVNDSTYDAFIYFGVGADKNGIITDDAGYKNMHEFVDDTEGKTKYLTLRMLDTDANIEILTDKKIQQDIIQQLIDIARENHFDGVVLDLELSTIPFTDTKNQINAFVKDISTSLHEKKLYFGMTIYGDTFYRARPYDVKTLSEEVDELYVMAYDFHKSRGEPGPNFPFEGKNEWGYDFKQMINDFTMTTESGKLTIVYGMYGYDWALGPQGKPLKQATAKTLLQIQKEYIPCEYTECTRIVDTKSAATKISYLYEGNKHILWYDDKKSVEVKSGYAREKGIGGISYWTNGYF